MPGGLLLSILADILAVLIYLGIITGLQTWQENLFWAFYLAAGFLIAKLPAGMDKLMCWTAMTPSLVR